MTLSPDQVAQIATDVTAAWNSTDKHKVARFCAEDSRLVVNGDDPRLDQGGAADIAPGFLEDVPDLSETCGGGRTAGTDVAFPWTLTGTHAGNGNPSKVAGWEE